MPRFKSPTTVVAGRRYRSQLEARWAVFFGLVGWPFEYEPYQLRGWVPDFLLLGVTPVLVEVKPVYTFPAFVTEKIEASDAEHEVLILGCTIPVTPVDRPGTVSPRAFGWLAERSGDSHWWWSDAVLGQGPFGLLGFHHREGSPFDRMMGSRLVETSHRRVLSSWAEAGNETQWGMR